MGPDIEFSPGMTPNQLAQWLFLEYGEAYRNDIRNLKDCLINGQLFLELLEDEELLDSVKISPTFKRLVKRKVSQVHFQPRAIRSRVLSTHDLKESFHASASIPVSASSGEVSLPQTKTTMCIPLCSTADTILEGDVLSARVRENIIWKEVEELTVKFLNDIPTEWMYSGSGMNVGNIIRWANEWSLRGGSTVPVFTLVDKVYGHSDIRVLFTTDGRRESLIGKRAQNAKHSEATMWLDLHSGGVGDDYKRHIVIHEFGHALGLGHEHQRSDFWKLINPYFDITKMKEDLNMTDKGFKASWDSDLLLKTRKCTAYDLHSIMHYWFMKDWLKNGYSDQSKVQKDRVSGALPSKAAITLFGVRLRSAMPFADRPSDMDIQLLKDLYGNTNFTILGLPSQPQISHYPKNVNKVVTDNDGVTGQSSPGTKLTLRLLGSLKTKLGERINVIQQVAPHWQDFATVLDLDLDGKMQIIDRKHRGDPDACCREMMQMWLRGMGRQPATLELLEEILSDCTLTVLAMQVKEAIPYN